MNLLRRVGGMLVVPRATLRHLPEGTGRHDATILALAWLAAVAVPGLGDAIADLRALGGLSGALGLVQGLWPLLPWLITSAAVEWLLGPTRLHRAALCLVPMLVLGAAAHALTGVLTLPGPSYVPTVLAGLAALALAAWVRPAIPTSAPDQLSPGTAPPTANTTALAPAELSPGTAPSHTTGTLPDSDRLSPGTASRISTLAGLAVLALVLANSGRDLTQVIRAWPTLAPASVGDPLPEFAAPLLDGGTLQTTDLRGRPHLLIFWTTWCGVCRSEMPMYKEMAAGHPGVQFIAVNADRDGDIPTAVRAYRDAHALPFPIALDGGAMVRGFRVRMYPHLVLVDAAGQIRGVYQGRSFARTLDAALTAAGG